MKRNSSNANAVRLCVLIIRAFIVLQWPMWWNDDNMLYDFVPFVTACGLGSREFRPFHDTRAITGVMVPVTYWCSLRGTVWLCTLQRCQMIMSNYPQHIYLFNGLLRLTTDKISKSVIQALCEGNRHRTGEGGGCYAGVGVSSHKGSVMWEVCPGFDVSMKHIEIKTIFEDSRNLWCMETSCLIKS